MIIGIPSGLSPAVLIGEVREGVEGEEGGEGVEKNIPIIFYGTNYEYVTPQN